MELRLSQLVFMFNNTIFLEMLMYTYRLFLFLLIHLLIQLCHHLLLYTNNKIILKNNIEY